MPKISFKVPPRLWDPFRDQTNALFLSMAPFLNYMVKRELPNLRRDLEGLRLSTRAKRYISGLLKKNGALSRNIDVEPETADALGAAVADHNLVRDAFMCRLIILLRSPDAFLEHLDIPLKATSKGFGGHLEEMPASPLLAMEAVRDDPLFYIRNHLEANSQVGLYRVRLPSLDWAACFLDDEDVPGTSAYRRMAKEWDFLGQPNKSKGPKRVTIRRVLGGKA